MNVLLTTAGRRSPIIRAFHEALKGRGEVLACDSSADAPALQVADRAFVVPSVQDDGYIDDLLTICAEHEVGLVVPALEPELPLLAQHRARFAAIGTTLVVSSPEIIQTCYDKLETERFLDVCGLLTQKTFTSLDSAREAIERGDLSFPLVVKPRWGVSSIGTQFPEDDEELELAYKLTSKQLARTFLAQVSASDPDRCILIQEQLGGCEYGLDVVNDLNNGYACTFARRKLRMRAGQTDRAVTVIDSKLESVGRTLGERLGHIGMLDCDVFVNDRGCFVIDINPRIGGGYPFSHEAGANFPAALIAWAKGEPIDPRWLRSEAGVLTSRADSFTRNREETPSAIKPLKQILNAMQRAA
jgi:carbamoyl-phosphate synthase large subunit